MTNLPVKVPACALIILNKQAEVLLLQQPDEQWSLPLAAMDACDTPVAAAERLAGKHLTLKLIDMECFGFSSAATDVHAIQMGNSAVHLHSFLFVSTYWEGDVSLPLPYQTHAFFPLQELPALAEPMKHYLDIFLQWLPERGFVFA
ncbi:MAG: NUDIX domain-containing protein [Reinekea sp.]|jgi:hypothetical protein